MKTYRVKPRPPEGYAAPFPPNAAQRRDSTSWVGHKLYDGAELRPFEGRLGAMDAHKLPSRGLRT